jgi:hypothetical protein
MMADIVVVTSAVLGLAAIVGLAVRFVLLPYLREQVVKPVQETHRQVTPHDRPADAEPTIVDRLDDLASGLDEMREVADEHTRKAERNRRLALAAGSAADAANKRISDHETWAREEDRRLWRAIEGTKP